MTLDQASDEIQLAVDLIHILECSDIAPDTVLKALAFVTRDYQRKLAQAASVPVATSEDDAGTGPAP